jgi:hypothetical protein
MQRSAAAIAVALAISGCGGSAATHDAPPRQTIVVAEPSTTTPSLTVPTPPKPPPPPYPVLVTRGTPGSAFRPAVRLRGKVAVSIAVTGAGIALLDFDQRLVELRLHSGTIDAGPTGWRFGPAATGSERLRLIAGFNGGFKLHVGAGGFESYGRVATPLRDGLGSIVTYTDGSTDIGTWHGEVPAARKAVATVRQNLTPLIDHGSPASTLGCLSCWGATLGGVVDPARSALGITGGGDLIWAGGEHATAAQLADAMLGAHVVRAVELDINPAWVAAYLYGHRGSATATPAPVPVMPGQVGISGAFLVPYSRDFFTVVARPR